MAVWNDAAIKGSLNSTTKIYSWTKEARLEAAKKNPIILMPASYLYFDLAYNQHPCEPGSYWAGYVDPQRIYSFDPLKFYGQKGFCSNVLGVEGALWSENIDSREKLDYFAFPKLLALSEVAWTPQNRRDWPNFVERVQSIHLKRLHYYGVKFHRNPPINGIN